MNEYKRGTELTTSLFRQLFISIEQAKARNGSIGPKSEENAISSPQGVLDSEFEVVDHVE